MYKLNKLTKLLPKLIAFSILLTLIYASGSFTAHAAKRNSLPTPGAIYVTGTTDTTISIAWGAVAGATHYYVDKWQPGDPDWINIDIVNAPNTSYTDTTLNCQNPFTDYGDYYRIRAYDQPGGIISDPTGWKLGSPLNDDFSNPVSITSTKTLNTCNANRLPDEDDPKITECNLNEGLATVWYTYTAGTEGAISFDTFGTNYDTFIAVWTGDQTDYDNGTLTAIACNNNSGSILQSEVGLQVTNGETYYIEVGQYYVAPAGTSATAFEFLGPPLHEQIH